MSDLQAGLENIFHTLVQLTSFFVLPDWNDVVTHLMPIAMVLFLLGPILTLLVLYALYQWAHFPRFRVSGADMGPMAVPRDAQGQAVVPASVPYCSRDGLLFPARTTRCSACRDELTVRCPTDGTLRAASLQTCSACGTRYVLGASDTSVAVRRRSGPPEGGAAVA